MSLRRVQQTGIEVEAVEGVEESLDAADYAGNRKESNHGYGAGTYEREIQRASLSKQRPIRSMHVGNINWLEEAVGGGALVAAPWHTTLVGMGMVATTVKKLTLSATPTNPDEWRPGRVIGDNATKGSATALGTIVKVETTGGLRLWYVETLGTVALGSVWVYDSADAQQGTGTVASILGAKGFQFAFQSETDDVLPTSCTVQRRNAGQLHSIAGARGTGGLSFRQEEPMLVRAEYQGVPVFDTPYADRKPREPSPALLAGVQEFSDPPKMSRGLPFILRDGVSTYTPIMTEFDLQFGNTLTPRPTITDVDLYETGHLATRITDRNLQGRIDPEHVLSANFDFIGSLLSGKAFELLSEIGDAADTHGLVVAYGPQVQLEGDYEPGDRDGIVTSPLSVGFHGTNDDEFFLSHLFD